MQITLPGCTKEPAQFGAAGHLIIDPAIRLTVFRTITIKKHNDTGWSPNKDSATPMTVDDFSNFTGIETNRLFTSDRAIPITIVILSPRGVELDYFFDVVESTTEFGTDSIFFSDMMFLHLNEMFLNLLTERFCQNVDGSNKIQIGLNNLPGAAGGGELNKTD